MKISELKKDAKIKLTGNYWKTFFITLVYIAITIALEMFGMLIENEILSLIYSIAVLVISLPFAYGIIVSMIKISRDENIGIFEFINIGLQNIGKVWKLYGRILLKLLLPIILLVISIITIIATSLIMASNPTSYPNTSLVAILNIIGCIVIFISIIYLIIKSLLYVISFYILYDKSDSSSKEIIKESENLMKGNRCNYILLSLSFIGWYLLIYFVVAISLLFLPQQLATIILSLAVVALTPYISISMVNFYEELVDENNN